MMLLLTSQPCSPAGWLEWRLVLSLDSPRCCYCTCTWRDKSLLRRCRPAGPRTPGGLEINTKRQAGKCQEGNVKTHTGVWVQVDLVGWVLQDFEQDYGMWLTWSSSSTAVNSINPSWFMNWIANERMLPRRLWHWERKTWNAHSWLYCKAIHPWESMGKNLGYLSKACRRILREERHE